MTKTIITCAVTGNQTQPSQNPALPISPEQIADSCLEAAEAGAAIVHIHVRHADTGRPSMEVAHYREVVERIRAKNTALIINLTTGPGGRYQPSDEDPAVAGPRTNLLKAEKRIQHVVELRPDVCSVDLNTMLFGAEVVINTPQSITRMVEIAYDSGVTPELELFDCSDIGLLNDLLDRGVLKRPLLLNLVLGVKYGFAATPRTLAFAADLLPKDAAWSGFGIGRHAFPMLAQAYLLGGHVRIGMEDTVHVAKGELTKGNGQLVEKSRWIINQLGGETASAEEARDMLGMR
ncbi:3-keto-5-aminohexanoate cleavage protein [Bosea sp. (in: a-proteobacteria)]|uniref:3-keto-5-aminohexanoate cleavage protein n=1 Tax=Bosea sp. (in: a-proteobacteria) TaxID=1871050 RepID=UPI002616A038|nr:3-keto-5-aminohexanoate cleavage protein [Bosea sp. (in: a-proteobacteria)]MCO5091212.1 3-keto-5-aminohexanoate cleavage protein [Bosea sp. (in: a-proteobacteria)]